MADETLIKQSIKEANYCRITDDCVLLGEHCPFSNSWETYVNKAEKEKIQKMIEDFLKKYPSPQCEPSVCDNISPVQCVEGKCYVECRDETITQNKCDGLTEEECRKNSDCSPSIIMTYPIGVYYMGCLEKTPTQWAIEKGDYTFCDQEGEGQSKWWCYILVAEKNKDLSICDKIKDEERIQQCYQTVRREINANQPVTKSVSITTDKTEYEAGENIKIKTQNNLNIPIWYAKAVECGMSFWILEDCQGKVIPYDVPCIWEDYSHHFTQLPSGEILEGRWGGMILDENYELKIADPGCYKLVFPYSINEKQAVGQGWEDDMLKVYSDELRIKEGQNTIQRPYLITPPCGTETTDSLIPFGWRSVDYDSKHLIQIDNNSDFSSPEVEEYETSNGIFQPEIPFKAGIYYWRVKSTKVEKEKCLPPTCAPNLNDPNDPCNEAIKGYKECKKQYSNWSDACQFTIMAIP